MANETGRFRKRQNNFTMISNSALRDTRLSLKAKGLYSLIQSYMSIDGFDLYKSFLLSICTEGEKAFESAWKELKDAGYLLQYRRRAQNGGFFYEYELLDQPEVSLEEQAKPEDKKETPKEKQKKKNENPQPVPQPDPEPKEENVQEEKEELPEESQDVMAEIKDQIGYDYFEVRAGKEIVDEILLLLEEVYKMPDDFKVRVNGNKTEAKVVKERYKKIDVGILEGVLMAIQNKTDQIGNRRGFLLTTLFNAPTTNKLMFYNKYRECGT